MTFGGVIEGTGIHDQNYLGLWTDPTGGGPLVVARSGTDGELGPGLGPGIFFARFQSAVMNRQGDIAFSGEVRSEQGLSGDPGRIWRIPSGGLPQVVAQPDTDGPLGPGLGDGFAFSGLGAPRINARRHRFFRESKWA